MKVKCFHACGWRGDISETEQVRCGDGCCLDFVCPKCGAATCDLDYYDEWLTKEKEEQNAV